MCWRLVFFFSSRRRHTRYWRDWSSDVCSSDLYLSLMNTYVKKEFMISRYPKVKVLKSENLLSEDDDSEKVAKVLYDAYKKRLDDKKNIVLFMGHGNPDKSYAPANTKYTDLEKEMHELDRKSV